MDTICTLGPTHVPEGEVDVYVELQKSIEIVVPNKETVVEGGSENGSGNRENDSDSTVLENMYDSKYEDSDDNGLLDANVDKAVEFGRIGWQKVAYRTDLPNEEFVIIKVGVRALNEQKYQAKSPKTMTKQEEFEGLVSEAARPFLGGRTDRFVEEVELFIASGLTIEAYDKVYLHHLGWKIPEELADDEAEEEEKEEFNNENTPLVPYLYIFDEDCDETD
ncbi:hypothetical protein LguiA_026153 [Lonicera macranthoides]